MPNEQAQAIVKTIREQRQRFEAFCRSLSEEELSRPVPDNTWLVKDFVSHLATLDPWIVRSFEAVVAGEKEEEFDLDAFNDAQVAERRDWPLERMLAEAAGNRAKLIETLGAMSDEELSRTVRFQGDAKRSPADLPLRVFLLGWAYHDPIHAADMLKALPERAADAELQEWISAPIVGMYQRAMSGPPRR
jgi:uncharacterized protein (TIGR03083 family)